jgi:hypothetical protein
MFRTWLSAAVGLGIGALVAVLIPYATGEETSNLFLLMLAGGGTAVGAFAGGIAVSYKSLRDRGPPPPSGQEEADYRELS